MIESLFIVLIIIGFLTMIIAILEKSEILSILSAITWILLMLDSFHIEIPFSAGTVVHTEPGFSGLCIAFIMVNIAWAILQFFEFRGKKVTP